ncbi:DNA-binding protein [Serratia marcescens]|nr:DNA-binding protein [Serratia marcescens]
MFDQRDKLYLLDANILINAHDFYYPQMRVPEFWDWILFHATNGRLKVPKEIIDEIKGGDSDIHAKWVHDKANKPHLVLPEDFDNDILHQVVNDGYAQDLSDLEIEKIGKDPFLIAYAMKDVKNRIVVTNETPKPSKIRANRKVPDVCNRFGVQCCDVFRLLRDLDFSTNWRNRIV